MFVLKIIKIIFEGPEYINLNSAFYEQYVWFLKNKLLQVGSSTDYKHKYLLNYDWNYRDTSYLN